MALPPTDNDDLGTYDPRAIWQTGSSLLSAILVRLHLVVDDTDGLTG